MFTIRFSVDDLSSLELDKSCWVIENRIRVVTIIRCGRYPSSRAEWHHFPGLIFKVVKVKMSLLVTF